MPNPIKYSTGSESNALKKGNLYIGTGDVGKGPSDVTGFYQGVSPSAGGYVIYMNKSGAPGGLSYHNAPTDAELISFTNNLAGESYTTVNECLVYYAGQSDKVCLNRDYEGIVTDGLVLNLDAGFTPSYPRSGTTWYDVSGTNNGTLTNGPTFNSDNGGSIVFDEVDDKVQSNSIDVGNNFTIGIWCKPTTANRQTMVANGYTYDNNRDKDEGFLFNIGNAGTDMFISLGRDLYGRISPTGLISANTWFYACASYNGSTINLYFNGTSVGGNFFGSPISINYNFAPFFLGGWNYPGDWFGGNISITQLYNRALSATEVLQNYNAQKGRFGL